MNLIYLFMISSTLSYGLICPPRKAQITDDRNLVDKVGYYDDIKPEDAEDFARRLSLPKKEVERRFDATGIFGCQTAWGQGNVVVNRETIAVPAHTLYVDKKCDQPRPLNRCAFLYQGRGKDELFMVDKILNFGGCSPGEKLKNGEDWAIIKLKSKVPSTIQPYGIPKRGEEMKAGDALVEVGKSAGFNPRNVPGPISKLPKAHAQCAAIVRSGRDYADLMQSNCFTYPGCSGCAILMNGDRPILKGIQAGEMNVTDKCLGADRPGEDGPFKANCRGSGLVVVEDRFLWALRDLKPDH